MQECFVLEQKFLIFFLQYPLGVAHFAVVLILNLIDSPLTVPEFAKGMKEPFPYLEFQ